ncbi:MAG: hypothetical protein H6867_07345 [Rhodospirillales bacterium]|nr:hypothetical protein [Rhodospirillales bacterium]MCB9995366.1 hypothetical protein [Rhodospirillales bacterium]
MKKDVDDIDGDGDTEELIEVIIEEIEEGAKEEISNEFGTKTDHPSSKAKNKGKGPKH